MVNPVWRHDGQPQQYGGLQRLLYVKEVNGKNNRYLDFLYVRLNKDLPQGVNKYTHIQIQIVRPDKFIGHKLAIPFASDEVDTIYYLRPDSHALSGMFFDLKDGNDFIDISEAGTMGSKISGGKGDDVFSGFGPGIIDGGSGSDKLIIKSSDESVDFEVIGDQAIVFKGESGSTLSLENFESFDISTKLSNPFYEGRRQAFLKNSSSTVFTFLDLKSFQTSSIMQLIWMIRSLR